MKFLLMPLILLFSLSGVSRETSVQDLFRLMNMDQLQKDSIDAMVNQQMQDSPQLRIVEDEYRTWMHDIVGWEAIKKPIGKEWKKIFKPREISDLIDFYKTSTGKKLLDKQPDLMGFSMQLMTQKTRSPEFQQGVQRIVQLAKDRKEALKAEQSKAPEESED